jgi:iron complex outermembrane receptor protein
VAQGGYATINAQAGFRFDSSGLRIGVYGRNLTNKDYLQGTLTTSAGFFANVAAPREIGISVSYGR